MFVSLKNGHTINKKDASEPASAEFRACVGVSRLRHSPPGAAHRAVSVRVLQSRYVRVVLHVRGKCDRGSYL